MIKKDKFSVVNISDDKIHKSLFKNIFQLSKKALNEKRLCDLSLVIADKQTAKRLNRHYKHQNQIADVLTFVYENSPEKIIGEIVICPKVIKKEQLIEYYIHSLLHFFGYHHKTKKDYLKMQKKRDKIYSYLK